MIDDIIFSEDDINFFHLEKVCNFADGSIYSVNDERYLLKPVEGFSDIYKCIFKYEVNK